MTNLTVTLDIRVLNRVAELTHQRLVEALQTLGEEIVADAQAIVPVRTGALRDSITTEQVGDLEVDVIAGMPYAAAVEYGVQGRPASPYLTPAVEKAKGRLPELVAAALQKAIEGH